MNPHHFRPVPKSLEDEDGPTVWRCSGCGETRAWEDEDEGECMLVKLDFGDVRD